MKIGAYQFTVGGNIEENMEKIKKAIILAADKSIKFIIFSECALTGYPPLNIESAKDIDFTEVNKCFNEIQKLSIQYNIFILIGSIIYEEGKYYNSAAFFSPDGKEVQAYHKRALWGWDKDNFAIGNKIGIFKINGLKIGVRICFEVRFPEYFRELYKSNTDINIVIFYDVSNYDDIERYELIKAHLKTRAVENISTVISVNAINPYQTAPTAVFDKSGKIIIELQRNIEDLLIYDFENEKMSFGEQGRKVISDKLI